MTAEQALEKLEAIQKAFPEAQIKDIALLIMRQELTISSALEYLNKFCANDGEAIVIRAIKILENRKHEGSFNCEARQEESI